MPGLIPENILEEILSRIDIVEVISAYIPLKRAGRNFKTTCPFHHEKTPSFMVSPERQIYHCFGCGESGNAFKFLMRYERLEFLEAVETLAKKAGVVLPRDDQQDSRLTSLTTQLHKINELAALFYINNLESAQGGAAKGYLLKRGIKEETIKSFKLGYSLDRWDALINHLRAKNISLSLLEKAGLALGKEGGGYYDRFRSRIIFPIFDIKSRILAFGGRTLLQNDKEAAKYVNSPETPIYIKGRNLYGLNLAKDAIRQNDAVVVVEGYLDFMMPYQEGVQNIVASLGTALTLEQTRLLKRYTHNVIMVYDADLAGQTATLRSLDIFIEEGMNVKVVSLPQGFDPDLFVRKNGGGAFQEKIACAENLFDYKLKVLKSRHPYMEAEGKARICAEMLETIHKFKNAVLKSEYLKKLAEQLDIKEGALLEELGKIKEQKTYVNTAPSSETKDKVKISPTEKLLLKLLLEESDLIKSLKDKLDPADFQNEKASLIITTMFDLIEKGKNLDAHKLIDHFGDEEISQAICESVFLPEINEDDKEKVVDDCIRRLKDERVKIKRQRLQEEIQTAQDSKDEVKLQRLMQEFDLLIKQR